MPETVKHRFVDCEKAQHAWCFAQTVFNLVMDVQRRDGMWDPLTWQQCLLGSSLPRKLMKGNKVWTVLRGAVIWIMWIDRNADCFADEKWTPQLRELRIWEALIDIVRTAWERTKYLVDKYPDHSTTFLARFDKHWLPRSTVAERKELKIIWKMKQPALGTFRP